MRLRLVQMVVALAKDKVRLCGLEVFFEQHYGPFRNGDQLGGCTLGESAFGTEAIGLEPGHEPPRTVRDEFGVVTLLLCSSLKVNDHDDDVVWEVGWLLGHSRAVTSTRILLKDGYVLVILRLAAMRKYSSYLSMVLCLIRV